MAMIVFFLLPCGMILDLVDIDIRRFVRGPRGDEDISDPHYNTRSSAQIEIRTGALSLLLCVVCKSCECELAHDKSIDPCAPRSKSSRKHGGYLVAIGLTTVLAWTDLPPYWGCIPKPTPDSAGQRLRGATGFFFLWARRGLSPLRRPIPWDLGPVVAEDASPDYIRTAKPARFSKLGCSRTIAPTTKYGMAPPPIESKKELQVCQSLLCLDCTLISFKVTARRQGPSQLRPGAHRRQKEDEYKTGATPVADPAVPTQCSNYEAFNCNNLNIRYWSGNDRRLLAPDLPPIGSSLRV
ncbi:hypothetical protein Tco_0599160 [Tanacetum coccineum]